MSHASPRLLPPPRALRPLPLALLVAALLAAALGCGPPPVAGPRSTGASSRAFVGDAEVEVRYRYEPRPGKLLDLHVELTAKGGDAGLLEVTVQPRGLERTRGEPRWQGVLAAGQTAIHSVTLAAGSEVAPTISIITRLLDRTAKGRDGDGAPAAAKENVELSSDTLRFVVADDEVRECRSDDQACQ